MSTIYVLPPRPVFVESLERFLQSWLPGLPVPAESGSEVADLLQAELDQRANALLIFREELPDEANLPEVLREGFGAEDGDRVIELHLSGRSGEVAARSWTV